MGYLSCHDKITKGVMTITACVLHGGMMGDAPLAPPGEDPHVWQRAASGAELESFMCGRALERMADDKAMNRLTLEAYARATLTASGHAPPGDTWMAVRAKGSKTKGAGRKLPIGLGLGRGHARRAVAATV